MCNCVFNKNTHTVSKVLIKCYHLYCDAAETWSKKVLMLLTNQKWLYFCQTLSSPYPTPSSSWLQRCFHSAGPTVHDTAASQVADTQHRSVIWRLACGCAQAGCCAADVSVLAHSFPACHLLLPAWLAALIHLWISRSCPPLHDAAQAWSGPGSPPVGANIVK